MGVLPEAPTQSKAECHAAALSVDLKMQMVEVTSWYLERWQSQPVYLPASLSTENRTWWQEGKNEGM